MNDRSQVIIISAPAVMLVATLLVLPQQLQAQNSKKYPVDVLSSKTTIIHYDDGTKVQQKEQTVKTKKVTYEELLADNKAYFDYLITNLGEDGKKIVEDEKKRLKQLADNSKEGEVVDAVEVGAHSITFGKALRETPTGPNKDPVNLVYYDNGRVVDVDTALRTKTPYRWAYGAGFTLQGYIDDRAHGGTAYWKNQDFQHEYPSGGFFHPKISYENL